MMKRYSNHRTCLIAPAVLAYHSPRTHIRSSGKNSTFRKSIQRRQAFNNYFMHSYYIVTISNIVVSIVCCRFIASSYWIPTLVHLGLARPQDYYWTTCSNISQDRHLSITRAIPSQDCTPKFITSLHEAITRHR